MYSYTNIPHYPSFARRWGKIKRGRLFAALFRGSLNTLLLRNLQHLGNDAGADGSAPFPDGEAEAFFHGDGFDELHGHADVVPGHYHFGAFGEGDVAGDVGGAEVELGPVAGEEGFVPAAFGLG